MRDVYLAAQRSSNGRSLPYIPPEVVMAAFESDLNSDVFAGKEGQFAAYVDGKLHSTNPSEFELFQTVRRLFPNSFIVVQPIEPVPTIGMRGSYQTNG